MQKTSLDVSAFCALPYQCHSYASSCFVGSIDSRLPPSRMGLALLPACMRQRILLQALERPRQMETGNLHDSVPLQALHVLHRSRASCENSASICLTVFASQPNIRGALHVRREICWNSPCVSVKSALDTRKQSVQARQWTQFRSAAGGFVNMAGA
jgi:hypothetical protein